MMVDPDWSGPWFWSWIGLATITGLALFFIKAPYGRHGRPGWGPVIPARLGWVVMEAPAVIIVCLFALWGQTTAVTGFLLACWLLHYVHRSFVYPFLTPNRGQKMPLAIALMGAVFNGVNGAFNGLYLFHWAPQSYDATTAFSAVFMGGAVVFFIGMTINRQSDAILRGLRGDGSSGYKVPHGGLYRWVSSPNYLGETIEWIGWAIMVWNPAGLAFAIWTAANLVPRAISHHRWYRETFPDYPPERKAFLPGVF